MTLAQTHLPLSLETAVTEFGRLADDWGRPMTQDGDTYELALQAGVLRLLPAEEGCALQVDVARESMVQVLIDLLSDELKKRDIEVHWQGARFKQRPANQSVAEVVAVERLSPSYQRVIIRGDDLARFSQGGLHFRLLFGPDGAEDPSTDENGVTQWPEGAAAWHRPVYTTREIICEGEAATLTFDVFIHDGGRVTEWTRRAKAGDRLLLTGPAGDAGQREHAWQGFVGDETALPVIARLLAALPDGTKGAAHLFVPEEADIQPLSHPEGVSVSWYLRSGEMDPLEALTQLSWPEEDRHVFFAAEKSEAVSARSQLRDAGFTKGEFIASAYWTKG